VKALTENELVREGERMLERFEAIQQPRSDFALAHFVVAQHDTPARQWVQAVLELQGRVFNLRRAQLDEEEKLLDLKKHRRNRIKRTRIELDLREMALARLGAVREANTLLAIVRVLEEQHGGPYTHEELQAGEPEYWRLRLTRQSYLALRAGGAPANAGNYDAILQASTEPGESRPLLIEDHLLNDLIGVDGLPERDYLLSAEETARLIEPKERGDA